MIRFLVFFFSLVISLQCISQKADIILYNGKIFTGEGKDHFVEAIAIRGEKISATGTNEQVRKNADSKTRLIDLEGKTVIPGINDAHVHVGATYPCYEFKFTQTPNDPIPWSRVKDSLQDIVKKIPPGTLIRTEIDEEILDDENIRRRLLDSLAPSHPVILYAWTGHGYVCNNEALKFLGFNEDSKFLGGNVGKYEDGSLNGLLTEYAGYRVSQLLASKLDYDDIKTQVNNFHKLAAAYGITTIQVMSTSLPAETFTRLYRENDFGTRNRIITFPFTTSKEISFDVTYGSKILNRKNYQSGIKLIIDGTPIERLAAVTSPYTDSPGKSGTINFTEDDIRKYVEACIKYNQQLLVHTSGDSAVQTILRRLSYENTSAYWKSKRPRFEHADLAIMSEADFQKLKQMGAVIVPNPAHFATPSLMNERFGSRTKYLQALKTLLQNDIPVAFGSDGPLNPYLNIMFAVIHPTNPGEGISVAEAVMAYTGGSAFAEGKENMKGKLKAGQFADLAVLSQDIFSVPPTSLPATGSVLTIVGGQVIHEVKR